MFGAAVVFEHHILVEVGFFIGTRAIVILKDSFERNKELTVKTLLPEPIFLIGRVSGTSI